MATPVASSTASGVASPSAHGQAITRTETPIMRDWAADVPRARCQAVEANARSRMAGTKTPTTRSATAWMRGREAWASSTARMMPASTVAAPVRVTSRMNEPCRFMVPPMTGDPGCFATGRDSPVTSDSSTSLSPSRTRPSAATRSPGTTSTRSPGRSSATGTRRTSTPPPGPSSIRRASRGCNAASLATASEARPLAAAST